MQFESDSRNFLPAPAVPVCRHCGRQRRLTARSICSRCFSDAAIRARYPLPPRKSRKAEQPLLCVHCRGRKCTRPRGLCRKCHKDKSIRRLYGPVSPHGRRMPGFMLRSGARPLPAAPTDAAPGSEEKIRVLQERIARGLCPWHPQDRPMDPESHALGVR